MMWVMTFLVAHANNSSILITENDADPENLGYELAEIERFPGDTSSAETIEAALEGAGYFVAGSWEWDSHSGDTSVTVRQR